MLSSQQLKHSRAGAIVVATARRALAFDFTPVRMTDGLTRKTPKPACYGE
jgi:hypothetical protein